MHTQVVEINIQKQCITIYHALHIHYKFLSFLRNSLSINLLIERKI